MADLSNVHRHVAMGDGKEGGSKTKQNFNIKKSYLKKYKCLVPPFSLYSFPWYVLVLWFQKNMCTM